MTLFGSVEEWTCTVYMSCCAKDLHGFRNAWNWIVWATLRISLILGLQFPGQIPGQKPPIGHILPRAGQVVGRFLGMLDDISQYKGRAYLCLWSRSAGRRCSKRFACYLLCAAA